MVEKFQKYKDILDREQEEFRKQLKREVSASWFFQMDQKSTFQTKQGGNCCKICQSYYLISAQNL